MSHDCQVINSASGRCWSSEVYNPCPGVMEGVPSSNDYQGGFGTALMTKVEYSSVVSLLSFYTWLVCYAHGFS